MTRRDLIRLGLGGTALSWFGRGCERTSGPGSPGQTTPKEEDAVYALTDGRTLYDDFDGHGNLQSYNGQHLAEPGKISTRIWTVWTGWGSGGIVDDPAPAGLLSAVDENGRRVEYRPQGRTSCETTLIYDARGNLVESGPHFPGEPYHAARRLFWLGAVDGAVDTPDGVIRVQKGKVYGTGQIAPAGRNNRALRLAGSSRAGGVSIETGNPSALEAADNKSFSADVLLSSQSTSPRLSAILDFHTTIPDQPPGKSWFAQIGIGTVIEDTLHLVGQYGNVNLGYRVFQYLGAAALDTWYNLRMDMLTRKDDSRLTDRELRIDFYVDGAFLFSSIPEDSEVILDARRTGAGPSRILTVATSRDGQSAVAFFDNVRAVYRDRIA